MELNLSTIITILALMGMGGMGVAQFRSKQRGESGDIVKFYKDRMEDYKLISETTRKEYTEKHEDLLRKFGVLQGEFNTEKALRVQYEAILKDKNPETETFMKLMVQGIKDQAESQQLIVSALTKNSEILSEIHTMAKAEHERDFNITATVTKSQ